MVMAIPAFLGAAATPLAVGGTALGAIGTIQQGRAQQEASNYNALVSRENAISAQQNATLNEAAFRRQSARLVGSQIANVGASNIAMTGSVLDVLEETIAIQEVDALNIRRQGQLQARSLEQQARLDIAQGRAAQASSMFGAAGQLLSGFGRLGG